MVQFSGHGDAVRRGAFAGALAFETKDGKVGTIRVRVRVRGRVRVRVRARVRARARARTRVRVRMS